MTITIVQDENTFRTIRDDIAKIIESLQPLNKDRIDEFIRQVQGYFALHNTSEESYWHYVRNKLPRKAVKKEEETKSATDLWQEANT